MKAKIIETGEIVEVYHEQQHGQTTNIYKEAVLLNGRMWTEDELDFSINLDLEEEVKYILNQYYYFPEESIDIPTVIRITAKHFYELGLKAMKGE